MVLILPCPHTFIIPLQRQVIWWRLCPISCGILCHSLAAHNFKWDKVKGPIKTWIPPLPKVCVGLELAWALDQFLANSPRRRMLHHPLEFDWQGCGNQHLEPYNVLATVLGKLIAVQASSLICACMCACVCARVLMNNKGQPWMLFLKYK